MLCGIGMARGVAVRNPPAPSKPPNLAYRSTHVVCFGVYGGDVPRTIPSYDALRRYLILLVRHLHHRDSWVYFVPCVRYPMCVRCAVAQRGVDVL